MAIRKTARRGDSPRLVIDISYIRKDGTKGRYRHDAQDQSAAGARAEERRILATIAQYGQPFAPTAEPIAPKTEAKQTISFTEAVRLFRAGKAVAQLAETTRRSYEIVLKARLLPRFGKRPIGEISHQDLVALEAELVSEELSASTRRNVMITLRSVLRSALDDGKLEALPKLPKLAKVGLTILQAMTATEVKALLAAAGPSARLAFALAAHAGLRACELRGLRWRDVDLAANEIVVRRGVHHGIASAPKGGDARRIPIAKPLRPLLEAAEKQKGNPHGPVCRTEKGVAWRDWGLLQAFKRAAARAGLSPSWRLHDLRHYFATTVARGSSPRVAQALLGHRDLTTTMRYAHVAEQDLRDAIGKLGGGNHTVTR